MTDDERQELLMKDFLRVPSSISRMQQVLKNASTYACLQFIWAKTGGWGRNSDTLAYSQFKNDKRYGTGLSIKTIQRSVEKLKDLGVITSTPSFGNMFEFTIIISEINRLNDEQAKSNSPDVKKTSQVNLSASQVNLSTSTVILSYKPSQFDLHTRPLTLDLYTRLITQGFVGGIKWSKVTAKKVDGKTIVANSLIDYWNENHGKGGNSNVMHSVWLSTVKSRLKVFSEDQIKTAMQSIIDSKWHNQNDQVLIKNAIDSNKRCEQAINKASQSAVKKPDKLSVNSNWENASKNNMVAANTSIDDMLGDL